MAQRKILITAALPYANGQIHIGHLMEYLQADFWNRYHKMAGHECHYVCADDTHGTPVMVEAKKKGITPEALIDKVWKEHTQDFKDFQIEFSHYGSTNSKENQELCNYFYEQIKAAGHIDVRPVEQLYCENDKMFLPDRFVKGFCPKCGSKDQYGDNCDVCGAAYAPTDLKGPYCAICGTTPVLKTSDHLMFKLDTFRDFLQKWIPKHTTPEMANKMMEWFKEPLRDWDISRDAPYFGFPVPGYKDKYFYVWVDAPMGYVSSTQQFCKAKGLSFDEFWKSDKSEVYHFLGKDIVYFHTLFWPAFLKCAGFRTPTRVHPHGRLTINGEKMSKSKGTQVMARTYLKHLDPTYLRYYYASKINSSVDDFDWSETDFLQKVNAELIGKITNLASRGAQMIGKKFEGKLSECDKEGLEIVKGAQAKMSFILENFEAIEFSKVISEIRSLAEGGNRYFDEKAPWKTVDSDPVGTQKVLTSTLNLFRIIAIYLKPFLPVYAEKVEALFNEKPYTFKDAQQILKNHSIREYQHILGRIEDEKVKALMQESKPAETAPTKTAAPAPVAANDGTIDIDLFGKVDLRVAKIIHAEEIKEADKLLRLKVDVGPLGERQIIAGIKAAYKPEALVGRLVVIVANLKPRQMKFGMSEGMVLAAGAGGSDLFVLSPDSGAKPGDRAK